MNDVWIILLILLLGFGVPALWHYGGTSGPWLGGTLGLVILIVIVMLLSTMI